MRNELLTGKSYGILNGRRIFKVKRGHYQIQHSMFAYATCFDGTKKEIERVLKSSTWIKLN